VLQSENKYRNQNHTPCFTKTAPLVQIIVVGIILFCTPIKSYSKDYFVTFVKEQFKEDKTNGTEKIYHTWFVRSDAGNKLLVLTGEDNTRRNWLREFIKQYDLFLIKVPDAETGAFEINTVFNIDVNNLHPLDRTVLEENQKDKKKTGKKKKK